jgi:thymidylate synthase (FAD)
MEVKFKSITPNIEQTIVEIARVSSSRVDKSEDPTPLINHLIKHKHWSPFEHGSMTMEVVTSKSIGIQLLRHVSFRFQEFSQRYARVSKLEDMEFRLQAVKNRQSSTAVLGGIQHLDDGSLSVWLEDGIDDKMVDWMQRVQVNLDENLKLYSEGVDLGVAKECARMILPMTTQTTIFISGTIRSWIHLLDIRDEGHAQKEIQLIAKEMKRIFIEQCPNITKARGWETVEPYQENNDN